MTGWHPTKMSCRKCGAQLWACWENGVIDSYKFMAPIEGCCCEVGDGKNRTGTIYRKRSL